MKLRGAVLTGLLLLLPLAQAFSLQAPVTFMSPAESIVKLRGDLQRDTIDGSRKCHFTVLSMKLDVAPQVIQAFPTAEEQNKCLAVVSGAVAALQASDKANKELGRAGEVTYIMAAGRPRLGCISARFNCKFNKTVTAMRPGFVMPIFGKKGEEQEVQGGVRGAQVAQVNVQAIEATGEILSLFIEVDLGYGRRVNVV